VIETMPANGAVISGVSSQYYVRFDRPIDHLQSFFVIKSQGSVVERLALRYETEPNVLFARAPTLAPGSYTMMWSLRAIDGNQVEEGEVAFSVSAR
jgi:methionine-rich copper-binding protein CopC